jgi:C1A family cysteine protease
MNIKTKLLPLLIATATLAAAGCDTASESPYSAGGGSSTNIISSTNFGITASELNPQVLEFSTTTVIGSTATTANYSDVLVHWSPVESEITVTAADNNGALVNSGTVFFTTQYGILSASSCELEAGRCSVTWESVASLENLILDNGQIDIVNNITAWTYGSEGFIDLDGDNRLSDSEVFFDTEDPYLDRNDNRSYDASTDDTIIDNIHDGVNGLFDGPNCDPNTRSDCGSSSLIPIFDSVSLKLDFNSTDVAALSVTIDNPADNFTVTDGTNINFSATATDPEDGTILGTDNPEIGNRIQWVSDQDGLIGGSSSFNTNSLSVNTHVITVTVTDSDANTATDSITVVVNP